jgi:predicted dehydrogenase
MAKPVVLVAGLRNQGRAHVPAFLRDGRVDVAICDLASNQVTDVGREHRIPGKRRFSGDTAFTDALGVLRPLITVVATPTATHRALSVEAAAAGSHVLCEKPLAGSADGGRALVDAVHAYGLRVWVGFHMRYMHDAVSTILAHQGLGTISTVQLEWVRLLGRPPLGPLGFPGGPIVKDLGSHQIDLGLVWLGRPTVRYAAGLTSQPLPDSNDMYDRYGGLLVCDSGQQVSLNMSYVSAISTAERASVRLIGDRGELLVPLMTARNDDPVGFLPTLSGSAFGVTFDSAIVGRATPPRNPMDCFAAQASDVITAALGGDAPTLCTGEDAYQVVQVVDGLDWSARSLNPVMFAEAESERDRPEA